MNGSGRINHPFVVWAACFMWLTSLLTITWSLVLFFSVGDTLILTHTDMVTALVLLSGIIMLPTNIHMLYTIANGERVDPRSKVFCCALWICIVWIIVIDVVGVILCLHRLSGCGRTTSTSIQYGMKYYRNTLRYKRFMDNLQWALKCCGVKSYKDWFHYDWHDKLRDYELYPTSKRPNRNRKEDMHLSIADSVPLSCCKSGSCVPNYLLELGTHSIHTKGCAPLMQHIILVSINVHLVYFLLIIIIQVLLLKLLYKTSKAASGVPIDTKVCNVCVRHLMPVNTKFNTSTASSITLSDDDIIEKKSEPLNVADCE